MFHALMEAVVKQWVELLMNNTAFKQKMLLNEDLVNILYTIQFPIQEAIAYKQAPFLCYIFNPHPKQSQKESFIALYTQIKIMASTYYFVSIVILALASTRLLVHASDPGPLQDFCVAINDSMHGGMDMLSLNLICIQCNGSIFRI